MTARSSQLRIGRLLTAGWSWPGKRVGVEVSGFAGAGLGPQLSNVMGFMPGVSGRKGIILVQDGTGKFKMDEDPS